MDVFTRDELLALGFASVGENVQVDRTVRLLGVNNIRLGDRVRIDCYTVISAGADGIWIGNNVHIAVGCYLFGRGGRLTLHDFSGLSARVSIYTASDDYLNGALTNPTVPDQFRGVESGPVHLGRHVIVGTGSVILPGVRLEFGAAVGALTVVRKDVAEGAIVLGNPGRTLPQVRNVARLRQLEEEYRALLLAGKDSDANT
jgi:acetyltransferase-like isoleucine patch superfamily enzyme